MVNDVLVIISCSKRKLNSPAPAKDLYQGDVFKKCQKWIEQTKFQQIIISAKYGIVDPEMILEPYEQKIKNCQDIAVLQQKIGIDFKERLKQFKIVILILGNLYYKVIKPVLNVFPELSIYRMEAVKGLFDYKKKCQ